MPPTIADESLVDVPDDLQGDKLLLDIALTGNPAAWTILYDRFHDRLLSSIRAILGNGYNDSHLIDEIAARVWYTLVKNDFEIMRRYDTRRGLRISTFLSLIAKNELRVFLRSERRRRERERICSRSGDVIDGAYGIPSEADFQATLTPAESAFYNEALVGTEPIQSGQSTEYSPANFWQLTRRVKKKLRDFLGL